MKLRTAACLPNGFHYPQATHFVHTTTPPTTLYPPTYHQTYHPTPTNLQPPHPARLPYQHPTTLIPPHPTPDHFYDKEWGEFDTLGDLVYPFGNNFDLDLFTYHVRICYSIRIYDNCVREIAYR